jgi:hypothetical protein
MKRISVILLIGLVLVACGEQTEPLMPLDKGAPNTVTLSNGEVVYKLEGELEKNGFKSVYVNTGGRWTVQGGLEGWIPATGKISENCNKIITNAKAEGVNFKLTLNRK